MSRRICFIGLDEPQNEWFRLRIDQPIVCYETLPRIVVRDGELLVEAPSGFGYRPVSDVVFHGIFADDHDWIAGLALWGGRCLPNARGMMDSRLKLPCLVRALQISQFAAPPRGFVSAGGTFTTNLPRVAKWGNFHCGENKQIFADQWQAEEAAIVEPYLNGDAVRVMVIGDQYWQIQLAGDDWLKSIHHPTARLMEANPQLVHDTQRVARSFGLEIAANDYIITADGQPHLLEVNHIPNVTRFPEIWEAYGQYVIEWLKRD